MEHPKTHWPSAPNNPGGDVASSAAVSTKRSFPEAWIEVRDVNDLRWQVRETRPTKYGFDLLLGFLVNSDLPSPNSPQPPRLIPTRKLVAFWKRRSNEGKGIYDLPATRAVLTKLRISLGFNHREDRHAQGQKRRNALKALLPSPEVAKRYHVTACDAFAWQRRVENGEQRTKWWNTPETLAILQSPLHYSLIAEKLGISHSYAFQLCQLALELPPSPELKRLSLPDRWQTPEALEALRSGRSVSEIATELCISHTSVRRLRVILGGQDLE